MIENNKYKKMKTNKFFLFLICAIAISACATDTKIPTLSRKQMQEDIDFLYSTIKNVSPYLTIREQVTGAKLYATLDSLHACSKDLATFEDFYYLASRMLLLCQDQHNTFQSFYPMGIENENPYIHSKSVEISEICEFMFDKYAPSSNVEVIYIDGEYFFPENTYTRISDDRQIFIPEKAKVIKINDVPIDEYINYWNRPIDASVRWDSKNKKYYTYRAYPYSTHKDKLTITYQLEDTIKTVELNTCEVEGWFSKDFWDTKINYFDRENILYLRIAEMDYSLIDSLKKGIWQHKNKSIQKVIIDVRDNGGGNDMVWREVLSEIVDKPILSQAKLYLRNTPVVIDYMETIRDEKLNADLTMRIGDDDFVSLYDEIDTIAPSQESILYGGNIYVLVDEKCFSSTLAFVAVCNQDARLVTVGNPTGFIGRRGITPFFFALPHSKLIFEISPTLDATMINVPEDYYDHTVDIPVSRSIDDYAFERKYSGERYGKDYLFNHDPVFQKVLKIE